MGKKEKVVMEKSLVLIADIEASRDVEGKDREVLQKSLKDILTNLNERGEGIVSPYTITLGDEFQAVFDEADHLFVQMLKIMAALHPVTVRFSLGIGSIDTPLNTEQAIGMDGPAFHRARKGIEILKENGFLFGIRSEDNEGLMLKILNNSLQLLSKQMRGWNKTRIKILYMLKEGCDYKVISDELDISRTAFYKNKEAGALEVIDELSDNMAAMINQELGS